MVQETNIMSITLVRDELDRNIGGGIPANSLILVEGVDGAGKSIYVQRLLYGMLRHDYSVSYVSTELNTRGFIEQMRSLDYDIKYHLIDGQLLFLSMFPYMGDNEFTEDFFDRLFNTKEIFEKDVIIFDTFSFMLLKHGFSHDKSFEIINKIKNLTNLNKTVMFCIDPEHLKADDSFLKMLRAVVDIYFSVELKTFAGNVIRVVNIKRFKRPGDYVMQMIPFKVEPGKGLAIEIASFD